MTEHNKFNPMNSTLQNLEIYASKAISLQAKLDPEIVGLSFGEPEFGPPEHALEYIEKNHLTINAFLDSVKRYEDPQGSLELRTAIADWYKRRYDLDINPNTEVMITHGGVEAITLALLCTSETGDLVSITDPSYMLYKRTIMTLGRKPNSLRRSAGDFEYLNLFDESNAEKSGLNQSKVLIINSPENPSGYMVDSSEWEVIRNYSNKKSLWVIHDEVYDTMAFERQHIPIRTTRDLSERFILINSFSKKFGIPGLRIGWMVANEDLIKLACKAHDYLYLGVNIQYEKIAAYLLSDNRNSVWLMNNTKKIQQRAYKAMTELGEKEGFIWDRKPLGAMFLFPNVRRLYERIPESYRVNKLPIGNAVAQYLLKEKKVAVVPGSVYGVEGNDYIRLVLCSTDREFDLAIKRLKS